ELVLGAFERVSNPFQLSPCGVVRLLRGLEFDAQDLGLDGEGLLLAIDMRAFGGFSSDGIGCVGGIVSKVSSFVGSDVGGFLGDVIGGKCVGIHPA
ncbi:MAG: hypothetical protein QF744_17065, partial [SAR202 cluster bacterium]|nr:hypothetical protein [SAR202 cluster bacterium]